MEHGTADGAARGAAHRVDGVPLPPVALLAGGRLVSAWAEAVARSRSGTVRTPEVERLLHVLTSRLLAALHDEPFAPAAAALVGAEVGAALVDAQLVAPAALGGTVEVLGTHLAAREEMRSRVAVVTGAVATGFVQALHERTLREQAAIRAADIEARREAEELQEQLRHQAMHDPLTGLSNRALFFERLAEAFSDPAARVGVCYLDLDGFKVINDSLGHDVGDELLVAVARRIEAGASPRHLVARMGGDEFVILVPGSGGPGGVTELAAATLAALERPFDIAGHQLTISASIGVVERAVSGTTPSEVMKAADITLYWAKSEGRGRWAVFDPERNAREVTRYTLCAGMPAALERGEFALEYQPLVGLADGAVRGVEALVRWHHPGFGVLVPHQFIDLAEETGVIVPLGRWVLAEACRQARAWQRLRPDAGLFVSVNLAARQTWDPDLVDDVAQILDSTGLAPGLLQVEVTESAVMGSGRRPLDTLEKLSALGVRIAVDDFGTGYSNLAYLRRLPVHTLKLAGSFVDGLRSADRADTVDEPVVATMVRLAHTLGLTVIAEGVEDAQQARRLRAIGCDAAQGWHFAPAAPAETVTRLLTEADTDAVRMAAQRPR